jgi:hypothetical protein
MLLIVDRPLDSGRADRARPPRTCVPTVTPQGRRLALLRANTSISAGRPGDPSKRLDVRAGLCLVLRRGTRQGLSVGEANS